MTFYKFIFQYCIVLTVRVFVTFLFRLKFIFNICQNYDIIYHEEFSYTQSISYYDFLIC